MASFIKIIQSGVNDVPPEKNGFLRSKKRKTWLILKIDIIIRFLFNPDHNKKKTVNVS
jgi:hypothetical protein